MKRVIGSLICQTSLAEVCIEANTKHRLGGVDFDAATRMPTSLTWYDWIGPRIKCLDDTTGSSLSEAGALTTALSPHYNNGLAYW